MEGSSSKQENLVVTHIFFTKLRVIWDKLKNFRLDPVEPSGVQSFEESKSFEGC